MIVFWEMSTDELATIDLAPFQENLEVLDDFAQVLTLLLEVDHENLTRGEQDRLLAKQKQLKTIIRAHFANLTTEELLEIDEHDLNSLTVLELLEDTLVELQQVKMLPEKELLDRIAWVQYCWGQVYDKTFH